MKIFLVLYSFVLFWCTVESNPFTPSTSTTEDSPILKAQAALDTILFANGKNATLNGSGSSTIATKTPIPTSPGKQQSLGQTTSTTTISNNPTPIEQPLNDQNAETKSDATASEADPTASTTPSIYQYFNKTPKNYWSRVYKVFFISFICVLAVVLILCSVYMIVMYGFKNNGAYINRYG